MNKIRCTVQTQDSQSQNQDVQFHRLWNKPIMNNYTPNFLIHFHYTPNLTMGTKAHDGCATRDYRKSVKIHIHNQDEQIITNMNKIITKMNKIRCTVQTQDSQSQNQDVQFHRLWNKPIMNNYTPNFLIHFHYTPNLTMGTKAHDGCATLDYRTQVANPTRMLPYTAEKARPTGGTTRDSLRIKRYKFSKITEILPKPTFITKMWFQRPWRALKDIILFIRCDFKFI